jgi:diadenylate cyclase
LEQGTILNADTTSELLNTIFWPGSMLHDMGVVIREGRIAAAGVQFPLAEGVEVSPEMGARHRAALGLSQESDAIIIVVSEETGIISIAQRGEFVRELTGEQLRERLTNALQKSEHSVPHRSAA